MKGSKEYNTQNIPVSKKVVLIADDHDDPSHMQEMRDYLTRKVNKHPHTFLATETTNNSVTKFGNPTSGRSQRSASAPKIKDDIIPLANKAEYKKLLEHLQQQIKPDQNRTLSMGGVDDEKLVNDNIGAYTATRNQAMKTQIENVLKANPFISRVYYPVGASHIYDSDPYINQLIKYSKDQQLLDPSLEKDVAALRNYKGPKKDYVSLGEYLAQDPNMKVRVKNFYTPNSKTYNSIQGDIDKFYQKYPNTKPTKSQLQPQPQVQPQLPFFYPVLKDEPMAKFMSSPTYKGSGIKTEQPMFSQQYNPTNKVFSQGLQSYDQPLFQNSGMNITNSSFPQQGTGMGLLGTNNQNITGNQLQNQPMQIEQQRTSNQPVDNKYLNKQSSAILPSFTNIGQQPLSTTQQNTPQNNTRNNIFVAPYPKPPLGNQQQDMAKMAKGGVVRAESTASLLARVAAFQQMVQRHEMMNEARKQPRPAPKQEKYTFDDLMRLRQYLNSLDSRRYTQQKPVQPMSLLDYRQQGMPAEAKTRSTPSLADVIRGIPRSKPRSRLFDAVLGNIDE